VKVLRKLKHSLIATLARKQVQAGASPTECTQAIHAGQVHLAAGAIDAALEAFQETVLLDPSAASAHAALGEAFLITDDVSHAEASFLKATNLAPDPSEGLIGVAHCALSTGHTDKARTFLLRVHHFQSQHACSGILKFNQATSAQLTVS
jgi:Flp pilus assembly protein TadD